MEIKNFHIIRSLERNTLSELFLGRHVHDNYYVKIRLFDQYNITNEEVREAILQRLRNSYQMRHRNIIATLDYGVEGRYMYQIQEHMDHGTLEDLLEKARRVPPEITVFVLQEILRGLQYAHSIGIFHGMLNPAKVLLASNGIVKIDDFQFLDLKNTFLKQVQTRIKRKQQMYLAPEHLLGKEADYRCDLFSVGVLAYKMLTGRHPFLEEEGEWTTMQITACNAKLLFELDPTLPPALEELVEKMIEKEPAHRVQASEESLRVLEACMDNFGEVRSYEVLANFIKKPAQSVEQLNTLRAEEYIQQAAQYQMQEQWDRALIAYHRAQFLRPKDRNIDTEIKDLREKAGYVPAESQDPKFLQLEQSLKANPDNIQVLQRLATLAKSRGDLLQCVAYYKRILRVHSGDPFAASQLKALLLPQERDAVLSPAEARWVKWQDFYRRRESSVWQRWSLLQGNGRLMAAVLALAALIGALHALYFAPDFTDLQASPAIARADLGANQKILSLCDQAASLYEQGKVDSAIEILSKAPLARQGVPAARARLLLAGYWLKLERTDDAMGTLEAVDIRSASLDQKIAVYKMKAEVYRLQNRIGHAIDQYINIKALPGVTVTAKHDADVQIEALQTPQDPQPPTPNP